MPYGGQYHAALLQQEEEYEAKVARLMDVASFEQPEQRQHGKLRGKVQLANQDGSNGAAHA